MVTYRAAIAAKNASSKIFYFFIPSLARDISYIKYKLLMARVLLSTVYLNDYRNYSNKMKIHR
jgi:hypothetical protein